MWQALPRLPPGAGRLPDAPRWKVPARPADQGAGRPPTPAPAAPTRGLPPGPRMPPSRAGRDRRGDTGVAGPRGEFRRRLPEAGVNVRVPERTLAQRPRWATWRRAHPSYDRLTNPALHPRGADGSSRPSPALTPVPPPASFSAMPPPSLPGSRSARKYGLEPLLRRGDLRPGGPTRSGRHRPQRGLLVKIPPSCASIAWEWSPARDSGIVRIGEGPAPWGTSSQDPLSTIPEATSRCFQGRVRDGGWEVPVPGQDYEEACRALEQAGAGTRLLLRRRHPDLGPFSWTSPTAGSGGVGRPKAILTGWESWDTAARMGTLSGGQR